MIPLVSFMKNNSTGLSKLLTFYIITCILPNRPTEFYNSRTYYECCKTKIVTPLT